MLYIGVINRVSLLDKHAVELGHHWFSFELIASVSLTHILNQWKTNLSIKNKLNCNSNENKNNMSRKCY